MDDGAVAGEWSSNHPINLRLSIPLPFTRVYLTVVAGPERRSAARRAQDRLAHPRGRAGNLLFVAGVGAMVGLAGFATVLLLLTVVLSVD